MLNYPNNLLVSIHSYLTKVYYFSLENLPDLFLSLFVGQIVCLAIMHLASWLIFRLTYSHLYKTIDTSKTYVNLQMKTNSYSPRESSSRYAQHQLALKVIVYWNNPKVQLENEILIYFTFLARLYKAGAHFLFNWLIRKHLITLLLFILINLLTRR